MARELTKAQKDTLRRGWTTGACATAATRAAYTALLCGEFPDPVQITLPKGHTPSFALATESLAGNAASAGIIKDAGDDPDVTHGALIVVTVCERTTGKGVQFIAGDGVGTVTKPGLPIAPGEAAINPVPRQLICAVVDEVARTFGHHGNVDVTISVPGGEQLAARTWNPRLGIVGGLSILGTTGVVIPYSCASWIHSIHRGIDVARATGLDHVAGCTGSTSEKSVRELHGLSEGAMLDMGDFAGGMLKYLRKNPVPRLTIGGGFGKLSKLAMGHLDLHSGRSQVNTQWLANVLQSLRAAPDVVSAARATETANQLLLTADQWSTALANEVAGQARQQALAVLNNSMCVDIVIIDRVGAVIGRSGD